MMSRRMRVRDDFTILADQLKKQARKASDPVETISQQPPLSVMNPFTRRRLATDDKYFCCILQIIPTSRHSISASLLGVGPTTYHQLYEFVDRLMDGWTDRQMDG